MQPVILISIKISHVITTGSTTSQKYSIFSYSIKYYGATIANILILKLPNKLPTDLRLQFDSVSFNIINYNPLLKKQSLRLGKCVYHHNADDSKTTTFALI